MLVGMRKETAGGHIRELHEEGLHVAHAAHPLGKFADNVKGNPTAGQLYLTNITPAQGALPIMVGNETIGAIGISGVPGGDKDEACAKVGIDKVAAQLK